MSDNEKIKLRKCKERQVRMEENTYYRCFFDKRFESKIQKFL